MAGEIDPALIKIYQCLTWAEGDSHGGDIDTGNQVTSGADQNIFRDITDAERISGVTLYRKVFIRNENTATWEAVKLWISQFTPGTSDEISITLGTPAGTRVSEGAGATYYSPDSKVHADVRTIGDLAQNVSQAIWIKWIVSAAGNGYTDDNFILSAESS